MNSDLTEEEVNNQKQNQELQMIHEQYQRANQEQIKLRKELTDAHSELVQFNIYILPFTNRLENVLFFVSCCFMLFLFSHELSRLFLWAK